VGIRWGYIVPRLSEPAGYRGTPQLGVDGSMHEKFWPIIYVRQYWSLEHVMNDGVPSFNRVESKQEAKLLQRDRAMFRVIEYFAKSLTVTQDHSK